MWSSVDCVCARTRPGAASRTRARRSTFMSGSRVRADLKVRTTSDVVQAFRPAVPGGPEGPHYRDRSGSLVVVVVLLPFRASSSVLYSSSVRSYQLIHAKPISSIVRLPLPTQLRGSGFVFVAELSCQLITCSTVPAG